jgi:hypothetical protein
VRYIAGCLGAEPEAGAGAAEVGKAAYNAARRLLMEVGLPGMKALGLDKAELLAVVPDEVVMQIEMELKAFGGVAPTAAAGDKGACGRIVSRLTKKIEARRARDYNVIWKGKSLCHTSPNRSTAARSRLSTS